MPNAILDGIETNYEVIGNGPPLLMYSPGGFDASFDKWSDTGVYKRIRLLDHLSKQFKCIVFDRRETGASGGRIERIDWIDYVEQGRLLLDHLGVQSAHVMGGCMGCCPVTLFAVRHPRRVKSMVLYWPVGGARFRIRASERFARHLAMVESDGLAGVVDLVRNTDAGFGKEPRVGLWAPVIRRDPQFAAAYAEFDVNRYKLIIAAMARTLVDRDTAPGAEPEDMLQLATPALIVPGRDIAHATSAARYLEESLPAAKYVDLLPEQQTEDNMPRIVGEFLGQVDERS